MNLCLEEEFNNTAFLNKKKTTLELYWTKFNYSETKILKELLSPPKRRIWNANKMLKTKNGHKKCIPTFPDLQVLPIRTVKQHILIVQQY